MVSIPEAIEVLFPAAVAGIDFRVENTGTGEVLTFWNPALGTQPTPAQISAVTQGQVDTARTAKLRATASAYLDNPDFMAKLLRAIIVGTLKQIKVAVPGYAVPTEAQIKAFLRNEVNSGNWDL